MRDGREMKLSRPPPSFRVVLSDRLDPYWNLAAEECLLDRAAQAAPVLFLWQSAPAVIIGKNQNPWRECNLPWMAKHGVLLARRISGGGAVFHDAGNLNYAFFMPREMYQAEVIFDVVLQTLSDLGFSAERTNRTSLSVDGLKVSGNAFCFRRNAALHHGTLLVSSDLEALRASLQSPPWPFETRATKSIRADVRNLSAWNPSLAVAHVRDAFVARCSEGSPMDAVDQQLDAAAVDTRVSAQTADAWLYGQTPPFEVRMPLADGAEIAMAVEKGVVTRVTCEDEGRERALRVAWAGRPFAPDKMIRNVQHRIAHVQR